MAYARTHNKRIGSPAHNRGNEHRRYPGLLQNQHHSSFTCSEFSAASSLDDREIYVESGDFSGAGDAARVQHEERVQPVEGRARRRPLQPVIQGRLAPRALGSLFCLLYRLTLEVSIPP